jgi:O-antigen/teichoic acid export membrane protein
MPLARLRTWSRSTPEGSWLVQCATPILASEPPVSEDAASPTGNRRVAWSIAANYTSLGASILFFIALLPYVNARLGSDIQGAWLIVLSAVGYLRVLDLGVGPATARFVAQSRSGTETNQIVATNAAVLAIAGLLGTIVALGLVEAASHGVFGHERGITLAMGIATISTALQVPLNIFGNVLFGMHRLVERNAFLVARVLGSAIAIVVTIELGGGLVAFVTAAAITELVVMIGQAVYCTVRIPGLRPRARHVQWRRVPELARFSGAVGAMSVAAQVLFYSDALVIGAAQGPHAAGIYAPAMRSAEGASSILAQFVDVFMPVFAGMQADEREDRAAGLLARGMRISVVTGFPLLALLIGLGSPLLHGWVGDGFGGAVGPLAMLAAALIFTAPLRFGVIWAIGTGRHSRVAATSIGEAILNLGLSIALVGPLGISGVALGTLIAAVIANGVVMPNFILPVAGLGRWSSFWRPVTIGLVAMVPLVAVLRWVVTPAVVDSRPLTALATLASLAFGILLLGRIMLTPGEREGALRRFRRRVATPGATGA